MKYTTINIQGNLISEEILQKIEKAEAQGQLATDFGFDPGSNIRSEIEYAWSRIKLDWKNFNNKSQILPASDPYGTSLSRKWMEQFLSSIGFDLSRQKSSLIGDNNQSYSISNTAENIDNLPVHIVGFIEPSHPDKNTLDIKTSGGTTRFSPHGTMQEYLNVTEHIYGIATNGLYLRLIRDCGRLIKLTYVEFDIKRMMDEDKYSEFTLLYRLLHASRFPRNKAEADQCLLEKYYQDSIETGNRIRDGLSKAVKLSLEALGNGFIQHESNIVLREKIKSGDLSSKDYYRQLLRVIYRFLFLMVTEERDLVYDPDDKTESTQKLKKIYLQFYSIARLRKLSENRYVYEAQFNDLWQGLVNTFRLFEGGGNGIKLGIQPLDGDLFNYRAIRDLQGSLINNKLLLECVRNLNEFQDQNKNLVPINYRSLDVEELGSVYEGLLELHPVIENMEATNPAHIHFTFHGGTDRKTTGSYYTRPDLVNELIKSALIPVIEERLKENTGSKEAQTKALLKLKVCDPAAGSGHMLLAAARTIAWYLARVQSGEENPAPSIYRKCLREAIQHCIYAVDYNPDAVELCKLALWLEGHNSGKPLSFLDHKIRNGNSLVGVTDLSVLQKGIPDDAFNAVTGDDKKICQDLKKENTKYNKTKQVTLDFDQTAPLDTKSFTGDYKVLEDMEQDDLEGVKQVKTKFDKLRSNHIWFKEWRACNLWTAAFFWNYTEENKKAAPNSERLEKFLNHPAAAFGPMIGKADALSMEHKFFHWPLEFPDVFEQGGFDVMLGNPPWEKIRIEQQEFFATRDVSIADAKNSSIRNKLIKKLEISNPQLFAEFVQIQHEADSTGKFIRGSGNFPLTSSGDINTFSIFSELFLKGISTAGKGGIIVPTGIATDDTNKRFFGSLVENNKLLSLFDFQNSYGEGRFFPNVHPQFKFCLLSFSGSELKKHSATFGFYLSALDQIKDESRIFKLTKTEIENLNPNSKTCPIFRTSIDAKINTILYSNNPIIKNNNTLSEISILEISRMFDMSSDSNLFRTFNELEAQNFKASSVIYSNNELTYYPLYEGKMVDFYNHRASSVVINLNNAKRKGQGSETSVNELSDSTFSIQPQYWVDNISIEKYKHSKSYILTYKAVTGTSNHRTMIASFIPNWGYSHSMAEIATEYPEYYIGCLNSIVFDYLIRCKLNSNFITHGVLYQCPVPDIKTVETKTLNEINSIILELTYTSWDIKHFADDVWKETDDELKVIIRKRWEENKEATGGHEWEPPVWCEIDKEGFPLAPFKWDEERRAVLKAELDAIYAKLYGLTTEELRYILDPQDVYGEDFPGETFRVLKDKEIRLYGEYRTRRLVLEAWEKLN